MSFENVNINIGVSKIKSVPVILIPLHHNRKGGSGIVPQPSTVAAFTTFWYGESLEADQYGGEQPLPLNNKCKIGGLKEESRTLRLWIYRHEQISN